MNNQVGPSIVSTNKFFTKKKKLGLVLLVSLILIIALTLGFTLTAEEKKIPQAIAANCSFFHERYALNASSFLGKYPRAAVAVDSAVCSSVGKEILLQNGSAVDATIAAAICNGVSNPQSMGIGGEVSIHSSRETKKVIAIDSREVAPLRSTEDMLLNASKSPGLLSGVPGELAGFWHAHKIAGRLPWKKLFEPTIKLCRDGLKVSGVLAESMQRIKTQILKDAGLRSIFINPATNDTFKANDLIRFPALAETLTKISENGIGVFYDGELSSTIVSENNAKGGILTLEDLKSYKPVNRTPIEIKIKNNYRLITLPPPSSGILVSFILNIMSRYNFNKILNKTEPLFYHRLVEAYKHAFAKRSHLGDIDFVEITDVIRNLTSQSYVDEIVRLIKDDRTFNQAYYGPAWQVNNNEATAHISIVAPNGDAVAFTASVNTYFGAKYANEATGIIFNDEMDDFSTPGTVNYMNLKASEPNFIKPGKRPMSSMSPLIVLDENDDARLVLGSSGGPKIMTAVALVAARNLFLGENIKEAIDSTRIHHQLFPNFIEHEKNFDKDVERKLQQLGHKIGCLSAGGSVVQGIERRENKELWANSDYRKGGICDGF